MLQKINEIVQDKGSKKEFLLMHMFITILISIGIFSVTPALTYGNVLYYYQQSKIDPIITKAQVNYFMAVVVVGIPSLWLFMSAYTTIYIHKQLVNKREDKTHIRKK